MNIALIGPSGAGKGTLSSRLARDFSLIPISTGDLFHDNLEHGTALGLLARKYMNRGELVPDEVVDAMVEEGLRSVPTASGVLFDGFPRTLFQAGFLDEAFREQGRDLDAVFYLNLTDGVAMRRLTGRLICSKCNTPYHAEFLPVRDTDVCDLCGGKMYRRPDDEPGPIRARLGSFRRAIGPVLERYQGAGRVVVVDADGSADEVYGTVTETLKLLGTESAPAATREQIEVLLPLPPLRLRPGQVTHRASDLVLLGGPGSGKGTQAAHLCREFNLPHISTGDLFRAHLKEGTELGKLARSYMDRGELVPDTVTDGMVEHRLGQEDAREGFLLDGFPRTLAQAEALDGILTRMGRRLLGAISIEVSDQEIVRRLSGRRICSICQASYHLEFKPPQVAGECDLCRASLCQRDDDNPTTIRARLKTFHSQSEPLARYCQQQGLLVKVGGEGGPEEVGRRVIAAARSLMPQESFYDRNR